MQKTKGEKRNGRKPYALSQIYPRKRAFITGAGTGLGRALALELARDGWTLGLADARETALLDTAAEVCRKGGVPHAYLLDLREMNTYAAVVQAFLGTVDGVDLVVNIASAGNAHYFSQQPMEEMQQLIELNQMTVAYGCKFFAPQLELQQSGHLVNVASAAAFTLPPGQSVYSMTQAAVWALTQSLWTELREFGVGVSCLLPGYYQSYGWTLPEGSEAGDTGVMNEVKMQAATATLSAQDVAAYLLKNVAKGKFDIIPPGEEKWLYWLHRIWPAASRQLRWYKFSNILNQRRKIGRKYAKWLRDQKTTQRKAVTGYIVSKRERLLQ